MYLNIYSLKTLLIIYWLLPAQSFANPIDEKGPRLEIYPKHFAVITSHVPNQDLTCTTAGERPSLFSQLKWSGPNSMSNSEELKKRHRVYETPENNNELTLEFFNPTHDDAGTYYCQGTYQSSDSYNASIYVEVVAPTKLEDCPERQFIIQGSSQSNKINCRISADRPRITIFKDGISIAKYGNRYKWDNDFDGIVINGEVNSTDAGQYKIKIKTALSTNSIERIITVDVRTKSKIAPYNGSESEPEFQGIEGQPARLECRATGNPQPVVHWFDPELRNLSREGGYIVNPESGTLQINKVDRRWDNGTFKCVADNTVGSDSRNVSMAVYVVPQIVKFENKTVDDGAEVTFECRSNGHPAPDFSVRRQGSNLLPYRIGDGVVKEISLKPEGGGTDVWVYQVKMVADKSHFGLHYCNATNRAGTAEKVGSLAVNYRPDLQTTPAEQFVKLGKKITITCIIKAYPAPTVTWLFDNTQVVNPDQADLKTSPDGQTHMVTMMPPSQLASGRFTCRAANSMGFSEKVITPRYTTTPGVVIANLLDRTPTAVNLSLSVPNDGGDRIKFFKYRLDGRTLDPHNPYFIYRDFKENTTLLDASPNPTATYTIRNLLPYYAYRMSISAINENGEGYPSETRFETLKPTKPEPPIIIKTTTAQQVISSEYSNGYVLKWSPPELDNGDPVTKYVIRYNKVGANALDIPIDVGHQRVIDQMSERPLHARLAPLEVNSRYKIQLQARNKFGDSEPASITILTTPDRPSMPEIDGQALAWLVEPSTPILIAILALAIVLLIVIDLIFCFRCQMGVSHFLRERCCPPKTNSVISDKTYN